jgi:MFS family permease
MSRRILSKAESIMLTSFAIWMFGWGMLGPLYATFAEGIGGDVMDLAWVYGVFLIVTGLGVFVVGYYTDRYGPEYFLLAGFTLSAFATYGYLLVETMVGLLVVQVLWGIALALSDSTWYTLYDRYSGSGENDGYIWGLSSGFGWILRGVGMILAGYLVTTYSFDVLFIVMGTILLVAAIYQAKILRYRVR